MNILIKQAVVHVLPDYWGWSATMPDIFLILQWLPNETGCCPSKKASWHATPPPWHTVEVGIWNKEEIEDGLIQKLIFIFNELTGSSTCSTVLAWMLLQKQHVHTTALSELVVYSLSERGKKVESVPWPTAKGTDVLLSKGIMEQAMPLRSM